MVPKGYFAVVLPCPKKLGKNKNAECDGMWSHCPPIQKWSKCDISCLLSLLQVALRWWLEAMPTSLQCEATTVDSVDHGTCGEHVGNMFPGWGPSS